MLRIMDAVSRKLTAGEAVPPGSVAGIVDFLTVIVDRCHHGKEEMVLFPAMEKAGIPRTEGSVGIMLEEHEQERRLILRLGHAVRKLESGSAEATRDIPEVIGEHVALLSRHIERENNVLFPMAELRLGKSEDFHLVEAFTELDAEMMGGSGLEALRRMLKRMEKAFTT